MESDEDMRYFAVDDDDVSSGNNFRILDQETIEKLQEHDVNTVAKILSVPKTLACSLLIQHKWCVETALANADLSDHREPVGTESKKNSCKICFEESNPNLDFASLACSHPFCVKCWGRYISRAIRGGPRCLTLTCPEPECKAVVGSEVIDLLASPEDKNTYYTYLWRSYIEGCKRRKWCPYPGCELAIELNSVSSKSFEVMCDCSHKFCFNCGEESHRPLDCETVRRWVKKVASDSKNERWILANTKPCPKCNRSIEKDQGTDYMICAEPCGHGFCWACLGPWKDYNHSCNAFTKENSTGTPKEKARVVIERYVHYYERCDLNRRSRIKAMCDLDHAMKEQLPELSDSLGVLMKELYFVIEAWERVIECRRVLRWSYAKGYYKSLNEDEDLTFFEFLQGQAESVLEKLHHCVEKELDEIKCDPSKFRDFRTKVLGLTRVTGNHFNKFVSAFEEENFCSRGK